MTIEFINVSELSARQMKTLDVNLTKDGASVLSVVISATGDMTVLSPFNENWTQVYLLNAGTYLPQKTAH